MTRNNKFTGSQLSLIGRTLGLTGVLLSLILFSSCGGGESSENPKTSSPEAQLHPKLAEGLQLAREKKYDEAISKVFEVVISNPEDAEAMGVMSYIYLKSNRLPHAREMAQRALAIDSYLYRPHFVLARINYRHSGFDKALDLARKALTINPEGAGAYQIIGEVYLRRGMIKDALTVLKEAVRLDPENPESLNVLASGYIKNKQYDHALPALMALQKLDPDNPGAHFNLAVVYAKMNEGNKAMRHITRAEDLYALDKDQFHWLGKARDIRRVIARDFKLRPEDIK